MMMKLMNENFAEPLHDAAMIARLMVEVFFLRISMLFIRREMRALRSGLNGIRQA
jgi:hypothetical protein